MQVSAVSDIGKVRKNNEDFTYCTDEKIGGLNNLYIVADGMGGHASGEVASQELVKGYCNYLQNGDIIITDYEKTLEEALVCCNKNIYDMSKKDNLLTGMGTTATILTIKNNIGIIAHVGDSRLYIVRNKKLYQQTVDHTYVNELFSKGKITKEELKTHPNRNLITRAIGITKDVKVDKLSIDLSEVDYILICSDGLTNMVDDEEILNIILSNNKESVSVIAQKLICKANDEGGNDNISTILIKL